MSDWQPTGLLRTWRRDWNGWEGYVSEYPEDTWAPNQRWHWSLFQAGADDATARDIWCATREEAQAACEAAAL